MAKSAALGDSPNPFFNVYRMYSEPGGIADEMKALAAANPDVMKLEQIGTSTLGKPIYVIKMTADARNVPDGSRPAALFSATNHAREWIAAEMGRRLPGWFAAHKNDPQIKELIAERELWFLPIQNPDGYDYTFTCGEGWGAAAVPCDYRTATGPTNRFWRKTMRDNNANGIWGDSQDGVDPNRNYPAKRGIDEEGASNSFSSGTYRGPYALSEPENLAVDRLQRRVQFKANINWHSAGQLLLTPVSYTTDYYPPDSTLFDAITGTDGDEAVFPYRSQHSSDLYESNGDTIDNAYMNYGIIGWTPEMDTCATMGEPSGCNQFASPDNESKVNAVFNKNLAFVLNVTESLPNMGRPKNFDNDPSQYRVKATQDIQPNRFDVSYGASQVIEATIRKELGDADITVSVVGQNGNVTVPMTAAPAGERYGEVKGYYFERRQATFPGVIGTRAVQAGDIVNVVVKAGGLQQEFRYRIAALPVDPAKKRVLVVAAEDYEGKSPNVTAGYDTAPRYLAQHKAALEAAGYEVETFDIDNPPANGGTPNPVPREQIKYPTHLGVMAHFDAVNYYSGDDFAPQDVTITDPRRPTSEDAQTGNYEMSLVVAQGHARAARVRQHRRQAARRRPQRAPAVHLEQRQPERDRPVHLDAGQDLRLLLPAEQRGRRRPARHRLAALAHDLQRHVAELPRRRRPPGRQRRHRHEVQQRPGHAGRGLAVRGHDGVHGQHHAGQQPGRQRGRHAAEQVAAAPAQLDQRLPQRAAAPGDGAGRLHHHAGPDRQRRRDHLDP